jgi:uroporphyrinogen-III synthase
MDNLPLAGIKVAVPATRRATETDALIRRWGGTSLIGPVLAEVPVEDEAPLRSATEEILRAPATWSLHLTGVGTRRWFAKAAEWGLRERLLEILGAGRVIARGAKSTAALAENGLVPEWTPQGETSAEMGAWLAPQLGPRDTVSVQLYGEPVPGLILALEATGARVVEVAPYRWALPVDPGQREAGRSVVHSIAEAQVQAIVVTSAIQATNLFAVARDLGVEDDLRRALRERIFTAVVGEVSKAGLEREDVPADFVASPPRLGALIRGLAASSEQIRAKAGIRAAKA